MLTHLLLSAEWERGQLNHFRSLHRPMHSSLKQWEEEMGSRAKLTLIVQGLGV